MSEHEHFEELCALAALGQISPRELAELNAHIEECDSCRTMQDDFAHVVHQGLPLADPEATNPRMRSAWIWSKDDYRQRFLARARAEGFHFSDEVERRRSLLDRLSFSFLRPSLATGLALLVLVTTGILAYRWRGSTVKLQRQVSELSQTRDLLQARLAEEASSKASLETERSRTQDARAAALAHANALEQQLQETIAEAKSLQIDLERAGVRAGDLESRLQEEERRSAALRGEIQKLRAARTDDAAIMAAQEGRLKELSEQIDAQTEILERERQLLAAGRDIRDLMGARNLHIIDVFDVDGNGKDRRPFGRVFYTEGKSLIFYAFDLANPRHGNAKRSFQAWGEREGVSGSAKSLGIFYVDDQAQKRWVLKVEDPELLHQIDAVFVTVEPFGGTDKPTGQKLLYAYLSNKANHP